MCLYLCLDFQTKELCLEVENNQVRCFYQAENDEKAGLDRSIWVKANQELEACYVYFRYIGFKLWSVEYRGVQSCVMPLGIALCPIRSLQMFGLPDFYGRIFFIFPLS